MEPVELLTEKHRPLKRSEFDQMGHIFAKERVELIRGVVLAMSPMGTRHDWVIAKLTRILVQAFGERAEVRVQMPFAASEDSEPQPDFAVVAERSGLQQTPREAFLIIEVSDSTLKYDTGIKADLYAESGVPEYWVVDVNKRVVELRSQPRDGKYTRLETFGPEAQLRLISFPDIEIPLSRVIPPAS